MTSHQPLGTEAREAEPCTEPRPANGASGLSLKALLDAYERHLIQTALSAAAGHQRRAAASLGLLPTTLHEKMKRLGLVKRGAGSAGLDAEDGSGTSA